jgi:hypothetical protein
MFHPNSNAGIPHPPKIGERFNLKTERGSVRRVGSGRLPETADLVKSRHNRDATFWRRLEYRFSVLSCAMFLATINKPRRLLYLNYIASVTVAELERGYQDVKVLLAEFPDGFQMLADLSQLDSMDPACVEIIGQTMELMDQHGVEIVVRVIPDPAKDIGLNIISIFHYPNQPRIVTCQTLTEAAQVLTL